MNRDSQKRENAEPQPEEQPQNFHPSPTGTPEERRVWADQVGEQVVQNMRNLPKDYITPY